MYASLPFFMAQLRDEADNPLIVDEHHEEWCSLLVANPLCCLLAPRDHGKSWSVISYLLWLAWRHNRDPETFDLYRDDEGELSSPDGKLDVLYFSDIVQQSGERMDTLRSLLTAEGNRDIFGDILPDFRRGRTATIRGVWAQRRVRLKNGFEVVARGFRTSTRGIHPKIIVLDDVLNDTNTLTSYQRNKTWRYLQGTVMPMSAQQVIVIGCLASGTPVLMADGTWRPIERVRVGEEVWSPDDRGRLHRRVVEAVIDQGVAPTVMVRTTRSSVRATPWHPFLVLGRDGEPVWRRADALVPGDRVVEVKEVPGTEHAWANEDFLWLFGYLFGDGWITLDRDIMCALGVHEDVNERVIRLLREWMPTVDFRVVPLAPRGGYVKGVSRPVARQLRDLGFVGRAKTKRVPGWVFRVTPSGRRAFLRGMCDADGNPGGARSTDSSRVELTNEGLIADIRGLAQTSGVRVGRVLSRTRVIQPPHSPEPVESTSWSIGLNFATVDRPESGDTRKRAATIAAAAGTIRTDRIVAVEPAQDTHVWDLTVEGSHSFVADGLAVHNTAFHYDDLLHRLKPDRRKAPLVVNGRKVYFVWRKYRSVNWDTGAVLWPERHDIDDLSGRRDADPLLFSREFQNDPRDDASSIFPEHLTKPAITAGSELHFAAPVMKPGDYFNLPPDLRPTPYVKDLYEFLVLSSDMALGSEADNDYCVVNVGSYNIRTQERKLIWALRSRGWDLNEQVRALRMACSIFPIDLGCIEHNSFQRWVRTETLRYPETAGRIVGHNTGPERQTLQEGVPSLVIGLAQRLWTIASGDKPALRYAGIWQTELNAFGWKDDKLQGVGEHDDTVMAFWLLERAVRLINTLLQQGPKEQYVGLDDVGIERIDPTSWDQPLAYQR